MKMYLMFVKSGFASEDCCFTLNNFHTILSKKSASVAESCVLQKQRFYVSYELDTQQRIINRSSLDRRRIDEERES